MKEFSATGETPERFIEKMRRLLRKTELGKLSEVEIKADDLFITFKGLGTSVLKYKLERGDNHFRAEKQSEKISFAHTLFRDQIENELKRIIESFGGKTS